MYLWSKQIKATVKPVSSKQVYNSVFDLTYLKVSRWNSQERKENSFFFINWQLFVMKNALLGFFSGDRKAVAHNWLSFCRF